MNKKQNTALITGASSGIGYELAKLFARDGYHVVLVARDQSQLEKVSDELKKEFSASVTVVAKDLSRQESAHELFDYLHTQSLHIDVLVNNAGFGLYGKFSETDLQKELDMITVNITSLAILTKLFIRQAAGTGKILNVASTAAFQPGPLMGVYYATKAFVLSFSEAVAYELQGTGITVTVLCPGPTESRFQQQAEMKNVRLVSSGGLMSSQAVAKAGYKGLMGSATIVVPGIVNKVLVFAVRLVPRRLVLWVVSMVHKR